MDRRRVCVRNEAAAAARFVHVGGADGDAFFGFEGALVIIRRLATLHANRMRVGDVLRAGG